MHYQFVSDSRRRASESDRCDHPNDAWWIGLAHKTMAFAQIWQMAKESITGSGKTDEKVTGMTSGVSVSSQSLRISDPRAEPRVVNGAPNFTTSLSSLFHFFAQSSTLSSAVTSNPPLTHVHTRAPPQTPSSGEFKVAAPATSGRVGSVKNVANVDVVSIIKVV